MAVARPLEDPGPETPARLGLPRRLVVRMLPVAFLAQVLSELLDVVLDSPRAQTVLHVFQPLLLTAVLVPTLWLLVVEPLVRAVVEEQQSRADQERHLLLESRVGRALEMCEQEDQVVDVVRRAFEEIAPGRAAQLLIAPPGSRNLAPAAQTGPGGPGCPVPTVLACPAVRRGQASVFNSPQSLDTCPYLRDRPDTGEAVCVPVTVVGQAIGVLHLTGPECGEATGAGGLNLLESLATRVGDRVGLLRALARSAHQAATDPLTGLLNRRSLEEQVAFLAEDGTDFAVVAGDLDHFKELNDRFGHAAGDRALRVFADTLRSVLRPEDLAARVGGEEFVLVLPHCPAEGAVGIAERIRNDLARVSARGGSPFTVSFGVAAGGPAVPFDEALRDADQALYEAKETGRDRVALAWELSLPRAEEGDEQHTLVSAPATQEGGISPSGNAGDERSRRQEVGIARQAATLGPHRPAQGDAHLDGHVDGR